MEKPVHRLIRARSIYVCLAGLAGTTLNGAWAADAAHTIAQAGRTFRPGEVTINKGESLTFTNGDQFIHQIYVSSPNFRFDTDERAPGENITQTFTQSGTFEVRCRIHPKMKLVVHVK